MEELVAWPRGVLDDPTDRIRWDDLTRHYWEVAVDLASAYRHRSGHNPVWTPTP